MFVPEEIRAMVLLRVVVVLSESAVVPEVVVPEVVLEGLEVVVMIREVFKGRKGSEKLVASSCCVPAAVLFDTTVLVVIVKLPGTVLAAERGDVVA